MSWLIVETRQLVGLLSDALLTAGKDADDYPSLVTVLLDCDRAEVEIESREDGETLIDTIPSDVLVATSTDGFTIASQGHIPCEGWLHHPVLLAADDVDNVVRTFTKKGKTAPKNDIHRTKVEISGDGVTFSEQHPAVFNGTVMTIRAQDISMYPRGLERTLDPDYATDVVHHETREPIPHTTGAAIHPGSWEIIAKVAKRRKMVPVYYRRHQLQRVIVEIGSMWRASVGAFRLLDEDLYQAPRVAVFTPRLPSKDNEAAPEPLPVDV